MEGFGHPMGAQILNWLVANPTALSYINELFFGAKEGEFEGIAAWLDQVLNLANILPGLTPAAFGQLLSNQQLYDHAIQFLNEHNSDPASISTITNILNLAGSGQAISSLPFSVIDSWFPNDNPNDPTAQDIYFNFLYLKQQNPNASDIALLSQAVHQAMSGEVHTALALCGLIEGPGAICDFTDGVLYAFEGQGFDATISILSATPGFGTVLGYSRIVRAANGVIHNVNWSIVNGLVDFGSPGTLREAMRRGLGTLPGVEQAHHILPLGVSTNLTIQRAAQALLDPFHINEIGNGISLPNSLGQQLPRHLGSHPAYSNYLNGYLNEIVNNIPPNYTTFDSQNEWIARNVRDLMNTARVAIQSGNGTQTINDIVGWTWNRIP
jgi:hypothetical protein